jgi:drug/metabolite transporter (DMT)-like permease
MNKLLGAAILAVGVALIVFGINTNQSFSSDVSRTFTGSPTNKAIWLLTGGAAVSAVGLYLVARKASA